MLPILRWEDNSTFLYHIIACQLNAFCVKNSYIITDTLILSNLPFQLQCMFSSRPFLRVVWSKLHCKIMYWCTYWFVETFKKCKLFDTHYFICIDVYKHMESSSATIVILCGISNRTAYCARIIVVHVAETILTVYNLQMEWELYLLFFFLSALSKPNV